ncbi:MAG: hypothetical protein IPP51_18025 [Bacteroidetes bacterium]|nr:hypothetical protein [Bacteroidota bacterium]
MAKADAATQKQLDDINGQVEVIKRQIDAQKSTLDIAMRRHQSRCDAIESSNRSAQRSASEVQKLNPINGTVLTKYAEAKVTTAGKPLYKIADLTTINLRAYVSGNQAATGEIESKK